MPSARIRGIDINYEIVGANGPWLALSPGGRNGYAEFRPLAGKIAAGGFRVLLHDRRNCGASEVSIDDSQSEDAHRIDDLHALLVKLDALPVFVGGSSSGCRMSLLYYLRHRAAVRGLLLMRVTGGPYPARALPEKYYGQFITTAEQGGMEAVCATDHWRACIEARRANRAKLMDLTAAHFIGAMSRWRDMFMEGCDHPVIGISKEELNSISVPTIVIPGNDKIHSHSSGRLAHSLIPNAVLHELPVEDTGVELVPYAEWAPCEDEIASMFVRFMKKALLPEGSRATQTVG
jgi:pimeloyl-ACP methyl ester carboxylesterase